MVKFKKSLLLMILLLLISTLFSTSLMALESSDIPFAKLNNPTELQDIIDTFSRLKYNFVAFQEGEKAQELLVEFAYQGKEEVDGVEADKIFVETSMETATTGKSQPSHMKFWLVEGEIVKIVQEGQVIPLAMANQMKDKMLQAVFFPFYHFEELNIKEIASTGKVTSSKEMIGEKEVDIFKIEGDGKNLAKYGLKSGTVKLANFEKFLMTVNFKYIALEEAEAKFEEGQFEVKESKLR